MSKAFNLMPGDYVILCKTRQVILARMRSLLMFQVGRYERSCDNLSYHSDIIEVFRDPSCVSKVCREWGLEIVGNYPIDPDRMVITTHLKESNR